jgi:cell division protein FtsI/penicillin-binding protein 2
MKRADWREYQHGLKRQGRLAGRLKRAAVLVSLAAILVVTFAAVWYAADHADLGRGGPVAGARAEAGSAQPLSKLELAGLLGSRVLDSDTGLITAAAGRHALQAQTTVDPDLQRRICLELARSGSLRGGCVMLDPRTGRILALASYDKLGRENVCLTASPAASLFKLVTAAAAIEEKRLKAESRVYYRGNPHGMPRSSITPTPARGEGISLADAFACSVNPVFGELGACEVGGEQLRRYGERFCFNRPIPFELALQMSHLEVPEDRFDLAKISAGYNRTTTITPVHAALLAAAVVQGGEMPEPCLMERVTEDGLVLYTAKPAVLGHPFSPETAQQLRQMMAATVTDGTCRRTLLPRLGRRRLECIEVGGKTGTISGDEGRLKYDWFAGYALDREGDRRVALAVFQTHGNFLGQKSSTIAAHAICDYFQIAEEKVQPACRVAKKKKRASTRRASTHRHRRHTPVKSNRA